jgi:hypothetical protein
VAERTFVALEGRKLTLLPLFMLNPLFLKEHAGEGRNQLFISGVATV